MANGINGLLVTVDSFGVTLQGSLFGSTGPTIDSLSNEQVLKVYSKKVQLFNVVSSVGNNSFYLPAVFGNDLAFIFVNGKMYKLGVDYVVAGAQVTWLRSGMSLDPTDSIVAFGPANRYTHQAFTFEVIDMTVNFDASDALHDNKPTITLAPSAPLNTQLLPFNQECIYFVKNNEIYSPGTHFTYSDVDNKIVWEDSATDPTISDDLMTFYYNQVPTVPYLLGDVLFRINLNATADNQSNYNITARPLSSLLMTANLFYDNLRYEYGTDFTLTYPEAVLQDSGSLKPLIQNGDSMDLSYFKDQFVQDSISLVHLYYDSATPTFFAQDPLNTNLYKVNITPLADPINDIKTLFFFRGVCSINKYYDNTSPDITTAFPGTLPEWERASNQFIFNSTARRGPWTTPPTDPLVPSTLLQDFVTWTAFTDAVSKNSIKIEYFQRTNLTSSITTSLPIKQNKCIVFYNGVATFREFGQFVISGGSNNVIGSFSQAAPPIGFSDEIVVVYFTEDSYASLWKFDPVILSGNVAGGDPIQFATRVNSITSSFLFNNGIRIDNRNYEIVPASNSRHIRLTNGEGLLSGYKIMLVHT